MPQPRSDANAKLYYVGFLSQYFHNKTSTNVSNIVGIYLD